MALMTQVMAWLGAGQAARVAEGLRDRILAQGGMPGLDGRQRTAWNRSMDALNRLPRPLMALGTLAMIAAALIAPDWFSGRMAALAEMPEALWWLIGAVISLFFGARFQAHEQAFARDLLDRTLPPEPSCPAATGADADLTLRAEAAAPNAALADWAGVAGGAAGGAAVPPPPAAQTML